MKLKSLIIISLLILITFVLGLFTKFVVRPIKITAIVFLVIIVIFFIFYEMVRKYSHSRFLEYILVVLALCFAFAMFYVNPMNIANLEVKPDSIEYAISAYNLYNSGKYRIYLNSNEFYPRYSFGYPLLIITFYMLFGAELSNSVYVSLLFSLGSVFLTYLIARKLFGWITGIVAMFLFTISPMMIEYSRLVMSEATSIFFILLITWLIIIKNKKYLFIAGLLAGFLISIRMPNFMIVLGFAIFVFFIYKNIKPILLFFFGLVISSIPLVVYNITKFGGIFRTGYNYWLPNLDTFFSATYVLRNFYGYTIDLLGLNFVLGAYGLYYQLSVVIFIGIGVYIATKRIQHKRFLLFTIMTTLLLLAFYLPYLFLHPRFMMLIIPMILIFGAYGITSTYKLRSLGWVSVLLVFIILLNTVDLTYATLGKEPRVAWRIPAEQNEYLIIKIADSVFENNANFISLLNGVYVTHYFVRKDRIYIPLSKKAEYMHTGYVCERKDRCTNISLWTATDNLNKILNLLELGVPLYVDDYSCTMDRESCLLLSRKFKFIPRTYNNITFYKLII